MNWYHAADGQQSGPFTDEQFRALIAGGTVLPATLVWETRLPNWIPLAQVPPELLPPVPSATTYFSAPPIAAAPGQVLCAECGQSFPPDEVIRLADRNVCAACKPILVQRLSEGAAPAAVTGVWVTEQELLQREPRVEIGHCLERGWKTITGNFGAVMISSLIFLLVLLGSAGLIGGGFFVFLRAIGQVGGRAGGMASIPVIVGLGVLFALIAIVVGLALNIFMAGYSWFYLNLIRHGQAGSGLVFEGFRRQLRSLIGSTLLQGLISAAISIPISILIQMIAATSNSQSVAYMAIGVQQLVSLAISLYLWTIWFFPTLLIFDKSMRAWPSMQLSRRFVSKRLWMFLLFLVVGIVFIIAGALACVIGLFLALPLFLAMKVWRYEDNFRDLQPTSPN